MKRSKTNQPQSTLNQRIEQAVIDWAHAYYQAEAVVYVFDREEGEELGRHVVSLAVQGIDLWQAAEVWVEDNAVVAINDLGEGLAPEGMAWPWPD